MSLLVSHRAEHRRPARDHPELDSSREEARARLADRLLADGRIASPAVEAAFRRVPRHLFVPDGVSVNAAYADNVVVTKRGQDGRASSSISAPWLQAMMLEAARLQPGGRVLEIGSGGYNAALIAEVVGPRGTVTSIDIDSDIVANAWTALDTNGSPVTATEPTLVVVRGNSGSGKTAAAREARRRFGRGTALLEQDYLRRTVLREHDSARIDPIAPTFITTTARTALDLGYHVILEGILHTQRYAAALHQLIGDHPGPVAVFYLDVSFDETVRRHLTRDEPIPVTPDEMRHWYTHRDLLDIPGETVIGETSTFEQTVTTILHTSGLTTVEPQTPCPRRCPHCVRRTDQTTTATEAP